MFRLYDIIPGYLTGKSQLVLTVTFTAFFSLVLLLLCIPLTENVWMELGWEQSFWYVAIFFCIALLLVIGSKCLMYHRCRRTSLSYAQYIGWNALEVIVTSALYAFFTSEADRYGVLDLGGETPDKAFFGALLYCTISLGIPYVLSGMYLALNDKDKTIRLMNYADTVTDEDLTPQEEKRITLFDNNGVMKLSLKQSSLCFIESDDNYIQVWYQDSSSKVKQYMLRCRLKTVEDSFADSDLVRCHRKYIVNINKVSVLTSRKEGYFLDMDIDSVEPIPVSKTYEQAVLNRFNSR